MTCVIPSQNHNILLFLMPVVQCIVAQWRHISSESAVKSVFSFPSNCYLTVLISDKYDAQPIAWDILLVLTTVAGNLCNKCLKRLLEQNSSYSDYFNAIAGLYRTADDKHCLHAILPTRRCA